MRHRNAGRQFSRNTSHRKAMFRALTANLVAHERIETTDAKAKELKRVAERLITHAVRLGDVAFTPQDQLSDADKAKRHAAQAHMGRFLRRFAVVKRSGEDVKIDLVEKVFIDLARRFKGRPGGYTRIIKLGHRRGDNAPMALVEFVVEATGEPHVPGKKAKPEGAKKAPKAAAEKKPAKKAAKAAAG
ncbi:MAG TPA: 50S ribosomal protein L17 [Polyangiaceae bacterium]|nr:50S ribosomal protein L17 [Polyangiaceae bacterium]